MTRIGMIMAPFARVRQRLGALFLTVGALFSGPACASDLVCDGEIANVATGGKAAVSEVVALAMTKGIVALGERHGVEAHPKAAACLLRHLGEMAQTSLVVEHLRQDQQAALATFREKYPETASGLGPHLRWWESGWPSWKVYAPLFDMAWSQKIVVLGGDAARGEPVPDEAGFQKRFGSKGTEWARQWGSAMAEAQCGLASAEATQEQGRQQVVRDHAMAEAVTSVTTPVVLFYAGRAHVRKDRSAIGFLEAKNRQSLSISLQEVPRDASPAFREEILREARGRFDFVWFAGSASPNSSPCENLRQKGWIK